MFIVLYSWQIKAEKESEFIEAWSEITKVYREKYDSLGSRLHRGSDGIWYSYAQWKSAEHRIQAFTSESNNISESSKNFRQAIRETLPEIELEIASDYLILPKRD